MLTVQADVLAVQAGARLDALLVVRASRAGAQANPSVVGRLSVQLTRQRKAGHGGTGRADTTGRHGQIAADRARPVADAIQAGDERRRVADSATIAANRIGQVQATVGVSAVLMLVAFWYAIAPYRRDYRLMESQSLAH